MQADSVRILKIVMNARLRPQNSGGFIMPRHISATVHNNTAVSAALRDRAYSVATMMESQSAIAMSCPRTAGL